MPTHHYHPAKLIALKRDGHALDENQLCWFIRGFNDGDVADYQMSAMAMAIFLRGMTPPETAVLTREMLASGSQLRWPQDGHFRVDKHSTGGIGDKISLILAPLLACCGLQVPMISGRGLGATGGTLDKLESIAGYRTDLSMAEMQTVVERVGCVITGASEDLAPADRKLYALRDVTGTVPSVPLITASILSKKLAEGLDALVLDVKFGSGAFMKTKAKARELAESLVAVASATGLRVSALLTDMHQPLGRMVGNAVEVNESLDVLRGEGPEDVTELTIRLCGELLTLVDDETSLETSDARLREILSSGRAYEKFAEMVAAQGGDLQVERRIAPERMITTTKTGYVQSINSEELGHAVIELGGGRRKTGQKIDHSVGLEMLVRVGEHVEANQPVVRLFGTEDAGARASKLILDAVTIDNEPVEDSPLVADRIVAASQSSG